MRHPRLPELILDGLIADPLMREALLGDLAEEWEERAADEGTGAADRWYFGQALRAVPHLFYQWFRETRWYVMVGILGLGAAVRFVTGLLGVGTLIGSALAMQQLGIDVRVATVVSTLGSAGWAFAGGALVARLWRRAPLPAVLWLTFGVVIVSMILSEPASRGLANWYLGLEKTLSILATVAGGMFVIARRPRRLAPLGRQDS